MPTMSESERVEFLAEVRVGVISIARSGRPPLTVPVWYQYEPGGDVLVQTSSESLKFRLVEAEREFSLVVQAETPPYRYVSVSGPVVAVEPETSQADRSSMAHRYLDRDAAESYLKEIEGLAIVTLHMRPRQWYSADYG